MFSNFLEMPFLIKIIYLLCVISPIMVPISVVTGSVMPTGHPLLLYGAASNIWELLIVSVLGLVNVIPAYHFMTRSRVVYFSFPISYLLSCCVSPLFLSALWDNRDYLYSIAASSLFNGVLISLYIWVSKDVKSYLRSMGHPDVPPEKRSV